MPFLPTAQCRALVSDPTRAARSQLGNVSIAEKCLEAYFLGARKYAASLARVELKDQYMCRALYALAAVVTAKSAPLKGKPLVDGIQEAIKHLLAGLAIAQSTPRYTSLIYNGSVQYWHTSRHLQRDKMRHILVASQEAFCNALDKVRAVSRGGRLLSASLCCILACAAPSALFHRFRPAFVL